MHLSLQMMKKKDLCIHIIREELLLKEFDY